MKPSRVLLLVFSVLLLGFSVVVAWKGYEKHREKSAISEEVAKLQEEAGKLEEETRRLNDRIAYLRTPEYVEREAKEKLNLKKPDESVAVVAPERFQGDVPNVKEESLAKRGVTITGARESETSSNPLGWWNYFFGAQ